MRGAKREQRQDRAACGEDMHGCGAKARGHAGDSELNIRTSAAIRMAGRSALLEAALDLAEDADVAILLKRTRSLELKLLLVLAVEHIKAEIELGQQGVTEHFETALVGFGSGLAGAGRAELKRIGLRHILRSSLRGFRGRRRGHLLKGERLRAAERQRCHQSCNGGKSEHRDIS